MLQGRWQSDEEEAAAEEAASQPTRTQMNSPPGEGLAHAVPGRTPPPDENWRKQAAQVCSTKVKQAVCSHSLTLRGGNWLAAPRASLLHADAGRLSLSGRQGSHQSAAVAAVDAPAVLEHGIRQQAAPYPQHCGTH